MRKEYYAEGITVSFDSELCTHVSACLRTLPEVFERERTPWIDPTQASPDRIAEVIMLCPTGALQYERRDGGPQEPVPAETTVKMVPGGPLYLHGNLAITDASGSVIERGTRFALCRCGNSGNKPFCDGSHRMARNRTE